MNEKERLQLYQLLQSLHSEVHIFTSDGKCIYPDTEEELSPALLQQINKDCVQLGKMLYRRSSARQGLILSCKDADPYSYDVLQLMDKLLQNIGSSSDNTGYAPDVFSQILLMNDISNLQIKELATAQGIEIEKPFQLIHIHFKDENVNANAIAGELYPSDTEDKLLSLSQRTLSILHYVDEDSQYETAEFADALYETIWEESGKTLIIGISEVKKNLYELRRAYAEAKKAIAINEKLESSENVVFYANLILERILLELSPVQRQGFYNRLFTPESKKALTEEMQHTINTFLEKDLNLSDTARHLFIHRNTLVYRLEKIQRSLGLDLKKFNDASIYKILSTMQKLTKTDKE